MILNEEVRGETSKSETAEAVLSGLSRNHVLTVSPYNQFMIYSAPQKDNLMTVTFSFLGLQK